MNRSWDTEYERWECWVKASQLFQRLDAARFPTAIFMTPVIQGLGRLDSHLILRDAEHLARDPGLTPTTDEILAFTDHMTLSYLWVLGAYEFVRTADKDLLPSIGRAEEVRAGISSVHRTFNRLRIPLAKMQAASRYARTDSPVAYPAINERDGVAWRVSEQTYISRRELSDALLDALEAWDRAQT